MTELPALAIAALLPNALPTEILQRVLWYLDNASWRQARLASRCFYNAQNYADILHCQMRVKVGAQRKWWPVCRSGSLMTLDARLLKYGTASASSKIGPKSIKVAIRAGRLDVLKWLHANFRKPKRCILVYDFIRYAVSVQWTAASNAVLEWLLSLVPTQTPFTMPFGYGVPLQHFYIEDNDIDAVLRRAIGKAALRGRVQALRTLLTFRSKYETDRDADASLFQCICEKASRRNHVDIVDLMNRRCARRRGRNGHVRIAALLPVDVSKSVRAIDSEYRLRSWLTIIALEAGSLDVLDYLFEDFRTFVYNFLDDAEQVVMQVLIMDRLPIESRQWLLAHSRAAVAASAKRRRVL